MNVPVSVVLGLLPAFLLGVGAWVLGGDLWSLLEGWTNAVPHSFLPQVLFLSMLPACAVAGPWLLRTHAAAASALLAPTRKEMAARAARARGPAAGCRASSGDCTPSTVRSQ